MRVTLDIADDVLESVKARASAEGRTIGDVLSDLARAGLDAAPVAVALHGFMPFPKRGGIVSNELINRLRDGDLP